MSRPSIPLIDRSDKIGKYSVVELLFMGVSSVFRQTFNFIDVKIYYKTDYKQKYYIKEAYITPRLKKADLDSADVKSYRPISNLSVLSKLLERLVARAEIGRAHV